jgi:IclR family acetate operon transcriptional repressor
MKTFSPQEPASDTRPPAERNSIAAAANVLAILKALAHEQHVTLERAAAEAGVSVSSAYRLLSTLESAGFAERVRGGGYRPGASALEWAGNLLNRLDARRTALPIVRRLPMLPGETGYFAVLRTAGLTAVIISPADASRPLPQNPVSLDSTVPLHAAALGRAVAIHLEPGRLAHLLGPEPYHRFTAKTVTTWRELSPYLNDTRLHGYATSVDEVTLGVSGVAAAVWSGEDVIGSISIAGPTEEFVGERATEAARAVVDAAREVSRRMAPGTG